MKIVSFLGLVTSLVLAAPESMALTPCAPRGTSAALYVNCGPISKNPTALKIWNRLKMESHGAADIANDLPRLMLGDDEMKRFLDSAAWKSAKFDWLVATLDNFSFRNISDGRMRIPQITCTLGGSFEAKSFREALIGDDVEKGVLKEIKGLDYKAYSCPDVDKEMSCVANVHPCFGLPQDGLIVFASNKTALKKIAGLYEGTVPAETSAVRTFAKSPNGVFAVYINNDASLHELDIEGLFLDFSVLGDKRKSKFEKDFERMLKEITQLRFFVSVESETDLRLTYEFDCKKKIPESENDDKSVKAIQDLINSAFADSGYENVIKDLKVSRFGNTVRIEGIANATSLVKLIEELSADDEGEEDDNDDNDDDDDDDDDDK